MCTASPYNRIASSVRSALRAASAFFTKASTREEGDSAGALVGVLVFWLNADEVVVNKTKNPNSVREQNRAKVRDAGRLPMAPDVGPNSLRHVLEGRLYYTLPQHIRTPGWKPDGRSAMGLE